MSETEPEWQVQPHRQAAADQQVVDDLGLGALVYGWRDRQPPEPLPFQMGHHVWELYRLPPEADSVARAVLARTSDRQLHWLADWPGRDRVLIRRPSAIDPPPLRGWDRIRRPHVVTRPLRDSAAAIARLDRTLEQVEVLEPLYVERALLRDREWERTVALLPDGSHVAICPWDWYQFVVNDFVDSCVEAVRREQG